MTDMRKTLHNLILIAMFTAIVSVISIVPAIPLPFLSAPITLTTLGVMLVACVLGARRAFFCMLLFIVLIAINIPVLPGFRAGLNIILGPTGGYILAWPVAAALIGFFVERFWEKLSFVKLLVINYLFGHVFVCLVGGVVFALHNNMPLTTAFAGLITFFVGDMIKNVIASTIALKMKEIKPLISSKRSEQGTTTAA